MMSELSVHDRVKKYSSNKHSSFNSLDSNISKLKSSSKKSTTPIKKKDPALLYGTPVRNSTPKNKRSENRKTWSPSNFEDLSKLKLSSKQSKEMRITKLKNKGSSDDLLITPTKDRPLSKSSNHASSSSQIKQNDHNSKNKDVSLLKSHKRSSSSEIDVNIKKNIKKKEKKKIKLSPDEHNGHINSTSSYTSNSNLLKEAILFLLKEDEHFLRQVKNILTVK